MKPELIIGQNGTKIWLLNGELHREDGPAVEYYDGTKEWYLDGKYHREDGPAIEYPDGTKYWYVNGECHRENGPAVERADGDIEWWLNGKQLFKEELISEKMEINYSEIYNNYLVHQIMDS